MWLLLYGNQRKTSSCLYRIPFLYLHPFLWYPLSNLSISCLRVFHVYVILYIPPSRFYTFYFFLFNKTSCPRCSSRQTTSPLIFASPVVLLFIIQIIILQYTDWPFHIILRWIVISTYGILWNDNAIFGFVFQIAVIFSFFLFMNSLLLSIYLSSLQLQTSLRPYQ